ncbi:DISARM system phospholipase D-like protein DrmC [Cryptosporangium sp. NPDC048952]|uniref:DISARM system phospholipase D-like protein DrmC n=1 Tax=Cryptosporangium sp. NPDC048952 TaxID=3363961 RepID=UPI00371F062F
MTSDPYKALGAFLTAYEADRLATCFQSGVTTMRALSEVHAGRRTEARQLLAAAEVGHRHQEVSVAVLRAIAGARSVRTGVSPVWTMPGSEATDGRLTREAQRIIDEARLSVVCSSFNFSQRSQMWPAIRKASERPGVSVTVYLNARTGRAATLAADVPRATVYRTRRRAAGRKATFVSHAKFLIVDRVLVLVTSANFSYEAENSNVELGLLIHDTALAGSIESLMREKHGVLYERVPLPE